MVSGRLSLPQSVSTQPFQAPARPVPKSPGTTQSAPESRDFKSSFAPEKQDLRSSRADRSRSGSADSGSARLSERESPNGDRPAADESGQVSATKSESKQSHEADTELTSDRDAAEDAATGGHKGKVEDQPSDASEAEDRSDPDHGASETEESSEAAASLRPQSEASGSTDKAVISPQQRGPNATAPRTAGDAAENGESANLKKPGAGKQETGSGEPASTTKQGSTGAAKAATDATAPESNGQKGAVALKHGKSGEADADSARSTSRADAEPSRPDSAQSQGEAGAEQDGSEDQPRGDRQHAQSEHADQRRTDERGAKGEAETGHAAKPESLSSSPAPKSESSTESIKAEARAEAPRAPQEPAPIRSDAPAPDASQPAKLAGPSVADRLSQASLSASDRAVLQARTDGDQVTNQAVARGMNAVLRQGGGALTMKLSPASLGEVRIEMSMQGGRVSLQFDVGNIAAYEAIKGQIGELKHSLEQRGMTVERIETHVSPALARSQQAENQSNQRGGEQPGQNEQQRQDAADGQSRGRADGGDRESHGSGWESPDGESQEIDFEQSLRLGLDAVA